MVQWQMPHACRRFSAKPGLGYFGRFPRKGYHHDRIQSSKKAIFPSGYWRPACKGHPKTYLDLLVFETMYLDELSYLTHPKNRQNFEIPLQISLHITPLFQGWRITSNFAILLLIAALRNRPSELSTDVDAPQASHEKKHQLVCFRWERNSQMYPNP